MSRRRREPKELSSECLPDEVVYDILTLLPVKSLIRFSDRTWTEISRFEIPSLDIVDFCNGMFCLRNYEDDILYLWNPRIRKFKMVLATPHFTDLSSARVAYGFGYHSQNNDFKILRIVVLESKVPPVAEADVYTLRTRKIKNLDNNIGSSKVKLTEEHLKEISDAVPIEDVAGGRSYQNKDHFLWKFSKVI
uniref:F-box associated beta-propeller type 1 domain-containing protein n=1 Tax=Fagus sylvatica TaxID=28930 RepID=A0A2N9I627_FAGSY